MISLPPDVRVSLLSLANALLFLLAQRLRGRGRAGFRRWIPLFVVAALSFDSQLSDNGVPSRRPGSYYYTNNSYRCGIWFLLMVNSWIDNTNGFAGND